MTGKFTVGKVLTATLLVTVFLLSFAFQVSAADNVYYYQVQPGDSLWLIGWRFEITADVVMNFNGLKSTTVYPGQALKIPSSTNYVRSLPTVSPQKRYTVQPGDTLFLLAKRFGGTVDSLMLVNKMTTPVLWVGQVLFVPDNGVPPTAPDTQNQTSDSGFNPPGTGTQPVDNGEQPPNIGTLPPANTIDYTRQLTKIGQWGQIPSGIVLYHVQQGDNLWGLSRRYNTSIDAIMKTNHLSSNLVQINQPLFIPQSGNQPVQLPYPTGLQNEGYGELLDWEYASWIADTHSIFTVNDMASGKLFTVRRYGGSNHLDAEPLTAADSAVMKEIFGEWTWISRPAIVYIGGKKLAASISGMPHSFDSIPDNNFAGHFDIYFLNSRTHNNNTIVDYHQKAVLTAAGVIR